MNGAQQETENIAKAAVVEQCARPATEADGGGFDSTHDRKSWRILFARGRAPWPGDEQSTDHQYCRGPAGAVAALLLARPQQAG